MRMLALLVAIVLNGLPPYNSSIKIAIIVLIPSR
jgi:hypothetical protein